MEDKKTPVPEDSDATPQGVSLTTMDVLQQRFPTRFRGYDVADVDSFLEVVAKEMERLLSENTRSRNELEALRKELGLYREKEASINAALLTVQKISNDVKDNARKEAELILSEAKMDAEKIVGAARQELAKIQEDINAIKQRKVQFEAALKSLLETHLRLLDAENR